MADRLRSLIKQGRTLIFNLVFDSVCDVLLSVRVWMPPTLGDFEPECKTPDVASDQLLPIFTWWVGRQEKFRHTEIKFSHQPDLPASFQPHR